MSADVSGDFLGSAANILDDSASRLLQRSELARDQAFTSEMILASGQVAAELRRGTPKVDHVETQILAQGIPVFLLQRGTCKDDILAVTALAQQPVVNCGKPGRAVRIGEWNASMHLFSIGGGVKVVRIQENPSEALREQSSDGRLPGTGDAHNQNDHAELWHGSEVW